MCAICGILEPVGKKVDENTLLQMRDTMFHRGPDAGGHYVHENVGLGHRRLKIIDLSEAGNQPLANEDGTVQVVFNGEIYNFKELRDALQAKGHRFRSHSDTEVIVHGYEEWGESCVERFNGMFAFAVYDKRRRELFLGRDHLGVKPLYYWRDSHAFIFASEIKAFLAYERFNARLNEAALPEYLLYRSLAGDSTLFDGVKALLPGHWLRVRPDLSYQVKKYWDLSFSLKAEAEKSPPGEEAVLEMLRESVEMQKMSDVPLGVQLSGGIDSSFVTALMAERALHPVKTFAVGFDEERFSELAYARRVAQHLKTEHHEIILKNRDFADSLEKLSWHADEPLTHSNSAGVYRLCQQAKPIATVLLTGEGSDEAFAGYHRYQSLYKSLLAGRTLARPMSELIVKSTAQSFDLFAPSLGRSVAQQTLNLRTDVLAPVFEKDWLTQALYYDLKTYLVPVLMRQDKMSMAHGVETRVPFLDHRLVELAFQLPRREKLTLGKNKLVIKRLASRYLPSEVLDRPKVGFSLPLEPWLRSREGLGKLVDIVTDSGSLSSQILPRTLLRRMVEEHRAAKKNHFDGLWTVLALEVWYRRFLGGSREPLKIDAASTHPLPTKRRPVVAHVTLSLKTGGLERVVKNMVEQTPDSNFKHIVCCLEERGAFAQSLEDRGFSVYCFGKKQGIDVKLIARLSQFFRHYGVQVVHTHNPGPHFYGLIASKLARVPVCISTRHGRNYPDDRKKVRINRALAWATDVMVPVSEDARKVMVEIERIDPLRIRRIRNGIDAGAFLPEKRRNGSRPVIGSIARLSGEKDHKTMLNAFRQVLDHMPSARLVIVGDGPSRAALHQTAKQLEIASQVEFLGERFDIPHLLNSFSIFTLSSTTEGLSMTILEAMASGLPVLATDVGGNRELVNPPECGLLVPARNPSALAEAYLKILADEGLRREMGQAARRRAVDHFSVARMFSEYEKLYETLLVKRAPETTPC